MADLLSTSCMLVLRIKRAINAEFRRYYLRSPVFINSLSKAPVAPPYDFPFISVFLFPSNIFGRSLIMCSSYTWMGSVTRVPGGKERTDLVWWGLKCGFIIVFDFSFAP